VTSLAPESTPLEEIYQKILDGSGNATFTITPGAAGSPGSGVGAARRGGFSWDVQSIVPSVSPVGANAGVVKSPAVSVFVSFGILQSSNSQLVGTTTLATTTAGPSSAPCLYPGRLIPGDWITVQVKGGDVGATAAVRIYGNANPPGTQ
jgi:hypothetical protein